MQRQQSKKAPKVQSQRAAPRKQSKKVRNPSIQLMGKNSSLTFRELPATVETTQNQPTWLKMEGKVSHPELGGGIRIAGRQLFANIVNTNGGADLFQANGATTLSPNSIRISPDTINGRLALQARTYDRYCFRKLRITYIPRVPTSQAGSFALGYVNDGGLAPSVTFERTCSMSPSMISSYYGEPRSFTLVDDMQSQKTWYTNLVASTDADLRMTVQGILIGCPDMTSTATVYMGTLWVDYLIDLYQPTADESFTLRLSPEEQKMIIDKRKEYPLSKVSDISSEIGSLQLRIQQLKSGNLNL